MKFDILPINNKTFYNKIAYLQLILFTQRRAGDHLDLHNIFYR